MPRPLAPLLSREQIATAALALIDGTGTFTLPGLARELGVSPSSIYHHFPGGREAIIEAIRGLLAGQDLPTQPGGQDWREFTYAWARAYRESFARHPRVVPLLTAQTVSDPTTLAGYEALARVLRDSGCRDGDLLHAVTILDCFICGSALDAGAPIDVWAASPDPESALGSAIRAGVSEPGERSQQSFEIGLRMIVSGLGELIPG
ncbi:tetracycline repressor, C-all-alpha domain protein [Actinoplanes sp. OR16]|uniref:TetR/AcrR family transcriptional regulator n=1 Tax=Actinoplanes sp. OR16 TaxID=946334 RepID=UPI000F6D6511|nr:TetR/AcrR family transcriptional regulator [Actinoplanes sp. OR16]BBH69090.1 tetracycline repressor, C-all-alpha domain protein [Actinoplanes sp. OR16]